MIRTCVLVLSMALLLQARNFYADQQAGSNGDGSLASPFKSIATAMASLSAGDTLFIRGSAGSNPLIYQENLYLGSSAASGTPGAPIVMKNYAAEKVRVILKDSFSIYSNWWVFEGLSFDMDGKANDVIKPKGDHITFRNCEVTNGSRDGFDINMANYLLIEGCTIYNFTRNDQYDAHGIILNGGTGNTIRNNTIYDCKGDCIQLYKDDQNYDTLIEGNDLYTTLGSGSENAIDVKATQGCIIRNNRMHGFHDSGDSDGVALKINKDSDNIVIEYNDIYESNGGFRISGGETQNVIFRYNVVHNLHADGGQTSKYGYGIQFDGVSDIRVYNNTFSDLAGPLFWIASRGATNLELKNNLFNGGNSFKGSPSDFNGASVIDYNGWFNCAQVITAAHNVLGQDPRFVDQQGRNFHLKEDSPAIDQGDPSFGTDFPGGRVDLGAFEYEITTSSRQPEVALPGSIELEQNYPNPFNPQTTIRYSIPAQGHVTLRIFNILGQEIANPVNANIPAGWHQLQWNAGQLPSGVYFYVLQSNSQHLVRSMLLVR